MERELRDWEDEGGLVLAPGEENDHEPEQGEDEPQWVAGWEDDGET